MREMRRERIQAMIAVAHDRAGFAVFAYHLGPAAGGWRPIVVA